MKRNTKGRKNQEWSKKKSRKIFLQVQLALDLWISIVSKIRLIYYLSIEIAAEIWKNRKLLVLA